MDSSKYSALGDIRRKVISYVSSPNLGQNATRRQSSWNTEVWMKDPTNTLKCNHEIVDLSAEIGTTCHAAYSSCRPAPDGR